MIRKLLFLLLSLLLSGAGAFAGVYPNSGGSTAPGTSTNSLSLRIYLNTGDAISDGTNKTILYIGPYGGGNTISLTDSSGAITKQVALTEQSVTPSETFRILDVFESESSGSAVASTTAWDSGGQVTGTITGATAANPCVLTATNTLSAGDLIGITGITGTIGSDASRGLNGKVWKVASATGSTITLEAGANTSALAYTSGGTFYKIPTARTTGLTWQNGRYLQTGALDKTYIGTIFVDGGGKLQDNKNSRLVWNYFNRLQKYMYNQETTATWTYTLATWRPRNNTTALGVSRNEFITGIADAPVYGRTAIGAQNTAASGGVAFHSAMPINTLVADLTVVDTLASFAYGAIKASLNNVYFYAPTPVQSIIPPLGYSFAQASELSGASGVTTWAGLPTLGPAGGNAMLWGQF